MKPDFVIYTRMLDIELWLFEKVNTFPKKQRFVLGQEIERSVLSCQRYIIEANNARGAQRTYEKLWALNVELEVLRGLLRVGYEMRFLSTSSLGYATEKINEIGKMCGGWMRRTTTKTNFDVL